MYQPPEDYLDILHVTGGGEPSHPIRTTQERDKVGEEGRGEEWMEGRMVGQRARASCYMPQHVHHGHIAGNHLEAEGSCLLIRWYE